MGWVWAQFGHSPRRRAAFPISIPTVFVGEPAGRRASRIAVPFLQTTFRLEDEVVAILILH